MHAPYHHHHKSSGTKKNQLVKFMDTAVYVIIIMGVAANIPQLIKVWYAADVVGVSLISWVCFFGLSVFWFLYGWIHKLRPVIVANLLLMFVQSLIVIGILVRH